MIRALTFDAKPRRRKPAGEEFDPARGIIAAVAISMVLWAASVAALLFAFRGLV